MSIGLAFKAFFKTFKDPKGATAFVEGKKQAALPQPKTDHSHLRLLSQLQTNGRLIDFFKEDITAYNDAQVGAVVRKIHQECGKSLEELVTIRPIMETAEGSTVTIAQGYDPLSIKVVGKVKGEAPYTGRLVHKGWKAHKHSLPKQTTDVSNEVIHPAEIEIK